MGRNFEIAIDGNFKCDFNIWNESDENVFPELDVEQYIDFKIDILKFLYIKSSDQLNDFILNKIKNDLKLVIIIDTIDINGIGDQRNIFFKLNTENIDTPVIISRYYKKQNYKSIMINSSVDFGSLLVDGMGDGILISSNSCKEVDKINNLSFNILQAARTRVTKTEFISCPSCGRTQFDLQETTAKVREKTSHLKGLKIAVMGCIVNGPGEMADADYGYVGTGIDKVSLYKKHDLIKKNINSKNSINELIKIIKENNDWVDPQ